jgi:NAD+ synthase (glutamine-hydrolysing)
MSSAPHGFLRVAAACPRVVVADPEANATEMVRLSALASGAGAQVVVFPELSITGYTAGDLFFSLSTLIQGAEKALLRLLRETAPLPTVIAVGLPLALDGRLFNVAALCQEGRLLGLVPKSFVPNYKEYYEERWFSSARDAVSDEATVAEQRVPFGTDLLFALEDAPLVVLAAEVCEDLWAPIPPSSHHAIAGATVLLNLSASNDLVAKADYRRELVRQQSGRTLAAYVYANTGVHESTTDVVFGGHLMVAENGVLLAEGERYRREGHFVLADVDAERLVVERMVQTSFADAVHPLGPAYRRTRTPSCRAILEPSTTGAARSSPSRPPGSLAASSTRAFAASSSGFREGSIRPWPSSSHRGPSTFCPCRAPGSWPPLFPGSAPPSAR